ncbi:glutathione S-transferase family protein [Noviherbaspirillum sp. UKPF54]|uniref:glutathione S-transferase family protein n=1 Tax=Noviherbaspirillum sp. UKPF54 TaxID=2601898 RepID=UPI001FED5162|nr:glutathione S-transferase family protein [Noviherbaspirillum sp. UKPF54]
MSVYLQNGEWHPGWYDTRATHGEFLRPAAVFRDWITADGSSGYPAQPGRYHLYVSLACPWAHRTLIVRALKRLEAVVSVSIVEPVMSEQGWCFSDTLPDHVNGFSFLHQLYTATQPDYSGRISVPVLWDKVRNRIVNNESSEIIRMLNGAFNQFGDASFDLCPEALRVEIDALNDFIYENINNGVYRCGFASTQASYENAFHKLFAALDQIEAWLANSRYLVGDQITEADWRLFTTLARFDAVYYSHFKCSRNRIEDFPHLSRYLRELYLVPGIASTVDIDHIKRHYFMSHPHINPTGIVPVGPRLKFCADAGAL